MPIEDIQDQFMSHALNLNAFANKEALELKVMFSDFSKELSDKINESEIGQMTYRKQKLNLLKKQADTTVDSLYNKIYNEQSDVLVDLALSESVAAKSMVNKALGVEALTTTITPNVALQLVSDSIIQGAVQKEWWSTQSDKLKTDYLAQVRMGMLAGESTDDIARRIAGRFNGTYDTVTLKNGKTRRIGQREGGIMNTSFRNAEALARTSIHTISNNAILETYKGNMDVIKGVELIVTLDDRTTEICISRSGMAWDLETGEPLPDSAPQPKSSTPIVTGEKSIAKKLKPPVVEPATKPVLIKETKEALKTTTFPSKPSVVVSDRFKDTASWVAGISDKEKDAIKNYTSGGYRDYIDAQKASRSSKTLSSHETLSLKRANLMEEAIDKHPTITKELYRGLSFDKSEVEQGDLAKLLRSLEKGNIAKFDQLSSFTGDRVTALDQYAELSDRSKSSVLIKLSGKLNHAADIKDLAIFSTEQEVVLSSRQQVKVVKVATSKVKGNSYTTIYLEAE